MIYFKKFNTHLHAGQALLPGIKMNPEFLVQCTNAATIARL